MNQHKNDYFSTKLLYIGDSYLKEFEAKVTKAGPRFVVLDKTAFYPESGGQPSDTGVLITEKDSVSVKKVMKRGREIFHYLEKNIRVGVKTRGVIDWYSRYYNMKRHSAEHLLTGLFEKEKAGPKVYSDLSRLDFKPSKISVDVLELVESKFNKVVDDDIPIHIFNIPREELDIGDDERKKVFLKNLPRDVRHLRMVEIGDYALTFCYGTHVKSTSEIGHLSELKLVSSKKNRRTVAFYLE